MPPPPGRRTLSHLQPPVRVHRSGSVIPSRVQVSSRRRCLGRCVLFFLSPILFVSLIYFPILDCSFLKRVCIYILCLYALSLTNVFGLLFGVIRKLIFSLFLFIKFISFSLLHVVPLAGGSLYEKYSYYYPGCLVVLPRSTSQSRPTALSRPCLRC